MATGKTNNPEGVNQYTKDGSSPGYRYSIGGYFATREKQQKLNQKAAFSKAFSTLYNRNIESDSKELNKTRDELNQLNRVKIKNIVNEDLISNYKDKELKSYVKDGVIMTAPMSVISPPAAIGAAMTFLAADAILNKNSKRKINEAERTNSALRREIDSRIYEKTIKQDSIANKINVATKAKANEDAIVKQARDYEKVSDIRSYSKNLINQSGSDVKQTAEKIRKRMWGD
jgi:hypothetical protein